MNRILIIAALLLGTALAAIAQPPAVLIYDSGHYLLTTGPDGVPVVERIAVIDRRTGADVPTPDEPAPDPSPDIELTKAARDWAIAVKDPQSSQALALVYRQVSDAVADGTLGVEGGIAALKVATDAVLLERLAADKWEPFRSRGSQELTRRRQAGQVATPEQLAAFMVALAHGLELAADGSEALLLEECLKVVNVVNQAIDGAKK